MPDGNAEPTTNLNDWDGGDVLAVVENPSDFASAERRKQAAVVDVAEAVLDVAVPAVPGLWPVQMLVLGIKLGQKSTDRQAHIAVVAADTAKQLVMRELLFFPNGGPEVGQVYGRHPLRRRDYLPYASFHRLLLHEKAVEAARYLLALGARDVEITCNDARGKNAKADAGIKTPSMEDVSTGMSFARDKTGQLAIRIGGAGKRSSVPEDLVWPGRDAMFKLAEDAVQAGAKDFHFGLAAQESGSVNAQAAVRIQKDLRLGLGGEYKRWEDLNLTVDAKFGANPS